MQGLTYTGFMSSSMSYLVSCTRDDADARHVTTRRDVHVVRRVGPRFTCRGLKSIEEKKAVETSSEIKYVKKLMCVSRASVSIATGKLLSTSQVARASRA